MSTAIIRVTGVITRKDGRSATFHIDAAGLSQWGGDVATLMQVEAMRDGLIRSDSVDLDWGNPNRVEREP